MIKAGQLRERIVIESYSPTRNANSGNIESAWSVYNTVWAQVKEIGGSESDEDGIHIGEATAEIIIRRDSAKPVTQGMRVNHNGYYWDILAVNDYGFNEGYKLKVRKRDNDAS